MGLNEYGLKQLVAMSRNGEVSPEEVARDIVAAVGEREGDIGAFVDFDGERLIADARAIGESGDYKTKPLAGIPIMIKDNICVDGGRTTCGSRILENYESPYDATVIRKLREAGAVIGPKTNLDEFAMGSSTEHSAFRPTKNPWNVEYTPGGSSGGSAACVASDMAVASLGSDTGGSIRQPAGYCGVVGMKPTYGRVSRYGLVAFASSLDQIGPFAKSVEDCALLLRCISGHDPLDATSLHAPVPDFADEVERGLTGLRVGVPRDFLEGDMEEGARANFDGVLETLGKSGVEIVDVSLPHAKSGVSCYYIIANAEASSNLARYDGVKYGYRTPDDDDIYRMYTHTRREGFGREVKRRILLGTYVLSAGYYDAYYLKAQKVRTLIIDDFNAAFDACDVIAMPTAPDTAFRFGEKADPLQMYLSDIFTIPINLAGLPGVSIPSGLSRDGLPYGLQLVGRALDEGAVLRAARGAELSIGFEGKPGA